MLNNRNRNRSFGIFSNRNRPLKVYFQPEPDSKMFIQRTHACQTYFHIFEFFQSSFSLGIRKILIVIDNTYMRALHSEKFYLSLCSVPNIIIPFRFRFFRSIKYPDQNERFALTVSDMVIYMQLIHKNMILICLIFNKNAIISFSSMLIYFGF